MGNPQPYRPPSIAEQGGIWIWLNLLTVRAVHNGLGSADLKQRVKFRAPITEIARDFNVKPNSIRRWLKQGGYVKKDGYYTQDTDQSIKPTEVPGQP